MAADRPHIRKPDPLHDDKLALEFSLLKLSRKWSRFGVLIQFLARDGRFSIVRLEVDKHTRGRGLARNALTDACDWADEHGQVLGITPTDKYGAALWQLAAFYASLGFVTDASETASSVADTMRREPKGGVMLSREAVVKVLRNDVAHMRRPLTP